MRAARMAHLRRLLCCSSLALVAAKRRSPSERTPERGPRRGLLFAGDADPERYYNASWTPGPPQAWNSTRRLTSTNLIDPAAHAVTSLPGLPADWAGRHWAGMVDSDDRTGGRLFYWLFEKKESGPAPVIIWLNGGPGCSSMDGLFLELGPLKLAPRGATPALRTRGESWHRAAHALFVDQPVGTGFSRTSPRGYCKNDQCIVDQFETFLARLARSHPDLLLKDAATSVPIYFAGESHAGHYIPLMVQKLLYYATSGITWDVKGAALGNAWVDPWHQYDATRAARALGIISDQEASRIVVKEKSCQAKLSRGTYVSKECWDLLDDVLRVTRTRAGRIGLGANQYDARDAVRSSRFFPPDHERVEAYMNRPDVRTALHVDRASQRFRECADPPYDALRHQDGLGVVPTLRRLLDGPKPVRLLFYNGDMDLICNHLGVERSLAALAWTGRDQFRDQRRRAWIRGDVTVGHVRRAKNLELLVVRDSGHMVPMDQPEIALDMIDSFITGKPIGGDPPAPGACANSCALEARHHGRFRRYRGSGHF